MRHYTQSASGKQIPLAFNLMASPESGSALRAAYTRLALSRHLTFEQVMANRIYAIGVRNLADAILRRRNSGKPNKHGPGARAIAGSTDSLSDFRPLVDCTDAE